MYNRSKYRLENIIHSVRPTQVAFQSILIFHAAGPGIFRRVLNRNKPIPSYRGAGDIFCVNFISKRKLPSLPMGYMADSGVAGYQNRNCKLRITFLVLGEWVIYLKLFKTLVSAWSAPFLNGKASNPFIVSTDMRLKSTAHNISLCDSNTSKK